MNNFERLRNALKPPLTPRRPRKIFHWSSLRRPPPDPPILADRPPNALALSTLYHHAVIAGLVTASYASLQQPDYTKARNHALLAISLYRDFIDENRRSQKSFPYCHSWNYRHYTKEFLSELWRSIAAIEFSTLADTRIFRRPPPFNYRPSFSPMPRGAAKQLTRLATLFQETIRSRCTSSQTFLYSQQGAQYSNPQQLEEATYRPRPPFLPPPDPAEPRDLLDPYGGIDTHSPPIINYEARRAARAHRMPHPKTLAQKFTETTLSGTVTEHRRHLSSIPLRPLDLRRAVQHIDTILELSGRLDQKPPTAPDIQF